MKRKRITALFFVFCLLFVNTLSGPAAIGEQENSYIEYVVKPGDTLWNIAKNFGTEDEDPRKLIYQIRKINGMETGEIFVNQIIKIPVKE